MFRDLVRVRVQAGDGGRGCVAFRREKYVPRGGPSGGDGGNGGDVFVVSVANYAQLGHLREGQVFKAERGAHGEGSGRHGRKGGSREIPVAPGPLVKDAETGALLADLAEEGERLRVAAGGKGGRGNARFATSTNQAPRHAEPGLPGERRTLLLELKLIADVGLVGQPNAGKTTLLATLTGSKGKVAAYPFTTLEPNLGILELSGYRRAVLADVPGLIEGAHRGEGLGLNFLRHIERTRALALLVDAGAAESDLVSDYEAVREELRQYSEALLERPRIVVATKTDLAPAAGRLAELEAAARRDGAAYCALSAHSGEGLDDFVDWVARQVPETKAAVSP
jgi:GTP-binding protein